MTSILVTINGLSNQNRPGKFLKTDAEIYKDLLISKNQTDPLMKSVKMISVREEQCFCAEEMSKEFLDQENEGVIAMSLTGSCYYEIISSWVPSQGPKNICFMSSELNKHISDCCLAGRSSYRT